MTENNFPKRVNVLKIDNYNILKLGVYITAELIVVIAFNR